MTAGSASITIQRPASTVFETITDVTRMGDWSPECVAVRWVGGAQGPAVGAVFEGDNVAKLGPVTVKRWTTSSEVVAYEPDSRFEFLSAGYTTWRFDIEAIDDTTTKVTESFSHDPYTGMTGFLYETLMKRSKSLVGSMQQTLERIKVSLEAT